MTIDEKIKQLAEEIQTTHSEVLFKIWRWHLAILLCQKHGLEIPLTYKEVERFLHRFQTQSKENYAAIALIMAIGLENALKNGEPPPLYFHDALEYNSKLANK